MMAPVQLPTLAELDALTVRHTTFPSFRAFVAASYTPTIRLDLTGAEGAVLAAAYNRRNPSRPAMVYARGRSGFRILTGAEIDVRAEVQPVPSPSPIASQAAARA